MIEYTNKNLTTWTRLGMRKAFGSIMQEIAKEKENLMVLAADIASSANLVDYSHQFPEKFINVGIAEQNMVGIASGLAREGNNVFITSFAPFVSMRVFEAIRTLIGYMQLNVKIVALSSGLSLGVQGNTHYCMEDIALLRTIPGMKVLSPADCTELAKCIEYLADYKGPAYLRLTGIDGSPLVYKENYNFEVDKYIEIREGNDVAILATGSIVSECIRASRAMNKEGISCSVFDVHTLKPLDFKSIDDICQKFRLIVTVEEHSVLGGLGGAIAELLAEKGQHPPLARIGIQDLFPIAGDYSYLLQQCELTALQIKEKIITKIKSTM